MPCTATRYCSEVVVGCLPHGSALMACAAAQLYFARVRRVMSSEGGVFVMVRVRRPCRL